MSLQMRIIKQFIFLFPGPHMNAPFQRLSMLQWMALDLQQLLQIFLADIHPASQGHHLQRLALVFSLDDVIINCSSNVSSIVFKQAL